MGDTDVLSPDFNPLQPQPSVPAFNATQQGFNTTQNPAPVDPAGPIVSRGNVPQTPYSKPTVKDAPATGMSPLQLGLRGALAGIAAGLAQRTAGQGAAAGANAGVGIAQQDQENQAQQAKAAQDQQEFSARMQMYAANLHLANINGIKAEQSLKNETYQQAQTLASDGQKHVDMFHDVDGSKIYGTVDGEATALQKAHELAAQGLPIKYDITGVYPDSNGKPLYRYTLYNPGDPGGQHTITQDDVDYFKSRNLPLPQGFVAGAKVGPGYVSKLQSDAKTSYVQDLQLQKASADTTTAVAGATIAQSNAKFADQKNQLDVSEGNARVGLIKAQTANQYAESVKSKLQINSAGEAKMLDTGMNPITKQKLTLDNAPDEMLVDEATKQPIPFKMLSTLKPTSQEINRGDFANSVLHSLDKIDELKQGGKLPNGPLSGLTAKALSKAGMSDADAQKALNFISFAQSAATGAHVGGRFNVPIMQKMGDMIKLNMDDSQFKGAEDSIRDVMTQYARQGGRLTVGQYKQQLAQSQQSPASTLSPAGQAYLNKLTGKQ